MVADAVSAVGGIVGYGVYRGLLERRIQASVADAAAVAEKQGLIARSEPGSEFYVKPCEPVFVRDRSKVTSLSLRKTKLLPPVECRGVILQVVERSNAIGSEDCAIEIARQLGFRTSRDKLRAYVQDQIDVLLRSGELVEADGHLRLDPRG